jgi:hypothetical protein
MRHMLIIGPGLYVFQDIVDGNPEPYLVRDLI